jgi:hypothetical protein
MISLPSVRKGDFYIEIHLFNLQLHTAIYLLAEHFRLALAKPAGVTLPAALLIYNSRLAALGAQVADLHLLVDGFCLFGLGLDLMTR